MKTRTLPLAGLVVLVGLATLTPLRAGQSDTRFTFKEEIFVGPGETQDNIVSIGGTVTVEGTVRKAVFAVGGTVTIAGTVGDSIVVLGGRVLLKPTAVVVKDLVVLGGTLTKEAGCRVDGDTVYFKSEVISEKFFKRGLLGFFSLSLLPIILVMKFLSLFIWALIAFVVASLFPRQVNFAAGEVRTSFWPIFGTGLLALVAFTVFVLFAAILSIVLIGIPILLALVFAGLIIKFFGRVAMLYFFGESMARAFHRRDVSALGGSMLGLLLFGFLSFVPFLGLLFTTVANIIGWGAAIRTKFGTTPNWFRRSPRPVFPPPAPTPPIPPAA